MKYRVELKLRDRDNRRGRVYVQYPAPSSISSARTSTASPLMAAIAPISDATLVSYSCIWSDRLADIVLPTEPIDIDTRVVFILLTDDGYYGSFTVWAPKPSIFETSGIFAGIFVLPAVADSVMAQLNDIGVSHPVRRDEPAVFVDCAGAKVE